jgi:hypothetical protein
MGVNESLNEGKTFFSDSILSPVFFWVSIMSPHPWVRLRAVFCSIAVFCSFRFTLKHHSEEASEEGAGATTPHATSVGSSSGTVEIRFIDMDWGGLSSLVRYPPFINARQGWWPIEDPTDQPILQDHDRYTLMKTLLHCRGLQAQGITDAATGSRKRPREGAD